MQLIKNILHTNTEQDLLLQNKEVKKKHLLNYDIGSEGCWNKSEGKLLQAVYCISISITVKYLHKIAHIFCMAFGFQWKWLQIQKLNDKNNHEGEKY